MPERLFRLYQRYKVININVNVAGAGLLAIALSKGPLWLIFQWIGPGHEFIKSVIAAAVDGIMDIGIYFALHWLANHWRPLTAKHEHDHPETAFWKNASVIQFQRLALTPLFYLIGFGGMYSLQVYGVMSDSWAFVTAYVTAIFVTRVIHTIIGLRIGAFERKARKFDPNVCHICGGDMTGAESRICPECGAENFLPGMNGSEAESKAKDTSAA